MCKLKKEKKIQFKAERNQQFLLQMELVLTRAQWTHFQPNKINTARLGLALPLQALGASNFLIPSFLFISTAKLKESSLSAELVSRPSLAV